MSPENLLRDVLELLIVVAVGAMTISAVMRIRRGQIVANHCHACGRAISRAYAACPKCRAPQTEPVDSK